jgi:menaquinone-dependent protoporphyrinogen oxidase
MKIAVIYATTEGQTRKIARFVTDRLIDLGHSVELVPADDAAPLDTVRFDAAALLGSVHVGKLQQGLLDVASANADALNALPTLLLMTSLAAAGHDDKDWDELDRIADLFCEQSGWQPGRTEHIAGAFRFTEYNFFEHWAMRWIASQHNQQVDAHGDTEYTDWDALGRIVDEWSTEAATR